MKPSARVRTPNEIPKNLHLVDTRAQYSGVNKGRGEGGGSVRDAQYSCAQADRLTKSCYHDNADAGRRHRISSQLAPSQSAQIRSGRHRSGPAGAIPAGAAGVHAARGPAFRRCGGMQGRLQYVCSPPARATPNPPARNGPERPGNYPIRSVPARPGSAHPVGPTGPPGAAAGRLRC